MTPLEQLQQAINEYAAAVEEAWWRYWLAEIIRLMALVNGFPIPPNAPNPVNCSKAAADTYYGACQTAYANYGAG